MTTPDEVSRQDGYRAFLGPLASGDWTEEQIAEAVKAFEWIDEAHPEDPKNPDNDGQMFSGAVMLLAEDATLREIANDWRAARQLEQATKGRLVGALMAAAATRELGADTEAALVRETGLLPKFVRKALNR